MRRRRSHYPLDTQVICGRFAASLVTCISLLQLPLPMLHSHDGFESLATLAEHVGSRHNSSMPVEDELHWHFLSPRELSQEEGSNDGSNPPETSIVCLAASGSMLVGGEKLPVNLLSHTLLTYCDLAARIRSPAFGTLGQSQPFSSLRPSVRACALLCVVRC
ncbi:hypothetical protein Pla144_01060 [Bythopirellula polymerisocia]|uniref:Uncharacterized protein n=1 Tax=Bythopirellula polymerisocia TaxID=2528003 RepID=A0A5C6CXR3_9BACT|nr:hypothetical protein Pla144_01060 [Bythopirellula polymerisocia]